MLCYPVASHVISNESDDALCFLSLILCQKVRFFAIFEGKERILSLVVTGGQKRMFWMDNIVGWVYLLLWEGSKHGS